MEQLVDWMDYVLMNRTDETRIREVKKSISAFMTQFPLFDSQSIGQSA
jgi:glycine/serine hydroxymethyltransferase